MSAAVARSPLVAVTLLLTAHASAAQTLPPQGASALCRDGTYSFSRHHQGTCSHHHGVAMWLDARDITAGTPIDTGQAGPTCGIHCGSERWLVKTLTDPDTTRIRDTVDATVEQLVALPRPDHLSPIARAAPAEITVYRVKARLVYFTSESDHDYHLVLASLADPNIQMIAEIPDPQCSRVCSSGRAQLYAQLRQEMMDRLDSPQSEREPLVRITGVGFFDYRHGQRGLAPNAIELHPVIGVEFLEKPAPKTAPFPR
jgi:Protein of unknown function (DUF3761)